MLERLVEQQKAVNLYAVNRGGIDTLTNTEWELAERIVALLKPFYETTIEISHDDACISSVVPIIAMLNGKLRSVPQDRGLLQMKAALRDAMNRRFAHVKTTGHFIAATMLDPRFKDAFFDANEKAAATDVIIEFLRSAQRIVQVQPPGAAASSATATGAPGASASAASTTEATATTAAATASTSEATDTSNTADFGLWDEFDSQPTVTAAAVEDDTPLYVQQLNAYLAEPRVPRGTNIYAYWHCSQFPSLEVAAHKYLSAPPTSVASEQLFSSAGQLYADRRSNLLGENAERLLFLSYNIRLLGFNY